MKKTKQTKFPVSRIKKIMQTDEDVGKVAMATPVLVSKALELFIASLVKSGVEQTRATGGKKMTAYHMKRTVQTNEMFDFLLDTVADIPDPIEPTPKPKAANPRGPRKPKVDENGDPIPPKPRGRKAAKKEESDDDEDDMEPVRQGGGGVKKEEDGYGGGGMSGVKDESEDEDDDE